MIIKIETAECPINLPQADEVLDSARFSFETGNSCVVTPTMKRCDNGMCRMGVSMAWKERPTAAEKSEMLDYIHEVIGRKPDWLAETDNAVISERHANDWLGSGKIPKPQRRSEA